MHASERTLRLEVADKLLIDLGSCGNILGRKGMERDSWKIIEIKLRRYPQKKKEYEENLKCIKESYNPKGKMRRINKERSQQQSITEIKALQHQNAHMEMLKKEIEAIEQVYSTLNSEEQKVIRIRYWSDRNRNVPYLRMKECCYSERQMKRIVYKVISQIAMYIGEI